LPAIKNRPALAAGLMIIAGGAQANSESKYPDWRLQVDDLAPAGRDSFATMMVDVELAESSNSTSRSAIHSRAAASRRAPVNSRGRIAPVAQGLTMVRRFLWLRPVLRSARVFSYAPRDRERGWRHAMRARGAEDVSTAIAMAVDRFRAAS
jgi:hypothetical protein